MPAPASIPKVVAAAIAVLAAGLGLRTYTLPMHGGPTYGEIRELLGRALGDSQPGLPGPPAGLPVQTVGPDTSTARELVPETSTVPSQPERWATEAVRRDSAAVRAWLGEAVLVTAQVDADTVETSFWRLALHPGCPWLSRLRARSAGPSSGYAAMRLVSLGADCPGPGGR